jgi:ribosomal protein S30
MSAKTKKRAGPVLMGRQAYIARLRAGETVSFREGGNSMTPRIKSRQKCTYVPILNATDVKVGDAVFCKVGGNYFTHLITAIRGDQYQISNNHGHVNGWITLDSIFGKVVSIEN